MELTCHTLPVTVWMVVDHLRRCCFYRCAFQFHAGLELVDTKLLAVHGDFGAFRDIGKWRRVPSDILTNRSFPSTATTSPLSTVTSCVGWRVVVLVWVCTCATVEIAKARHNITACIKLWCLAARIFGQQRRQYCKWRAHKQLRQRWFLWNK